MMLSFKDMFNSLRRSPVHLLHSLRQASGRRLTSLVLLGMSLGIFAVLRSYAQPLFDRNGLFPAEKDMVPIDHLHIGLFKDVCPGLGTGVTRSEMEECLSQENDLSTKLHLLPIPTLKEILKTQPPRFRDVLTKNNLSKIADGIVNKDVYVIEIDIPKEYFENAEITDTRHVLSFHMIVASTICIDRECSISRARFDPYGYGIPLLRGKNPIAGDTVRVWIFAQDKAFPAGLTLKFGVFITRSELIQALYERGPFSQWGKPLFFVMMLFALMLSVMLYAIFEGFVDDAAVAYLGASTAFYIFCQQTRMINPDATLLEYWQLLLLGPLNLFAAICTHTYATLRVKAWAVISVFFVFLICNVIVCFKLFPQDPNYLASHQPIHTYYFAQLLRLPIIFSFVGIGNLLHRAYTADGVNKFVFIRRILFEQIPFLLCLFAYFNTFSELAEKRKMAIETELFSTSLVEIFFFVFAINFLNKFIGSFLIKQNSSSASESDVVAQNLPQVVRKHWEASNWDIILIDLDIGGFTLATKHLRSHTQDLVEKLGYGLRQLTSSADLEWLFAGTVGDQWLVALKTLSKKRPIDELRSVVSILQESSWKLDEVVDFFAKSFNVELSLHINCYLLQDATLGGPLRKDYDVKELERLLIQLFPKGDDGKFKKEPELHCEGLNFLLKFSHKTAHDEILVAGPQHLLAEWTELTQSSFATHATSRDASFKHSQRLRELDMKYGIVERTTSAKRNKAG